MGDIHSITWLEMDLTTWSGASKESSAPGWQWHGERCLFFAKCRSSTGCGRPRMCLKRGCAESGRIWRAQPWDDRRCLLPPINNARPVYSETARPFRFGRSWYEGA
jgi:hypothetical protein